MTLTRSWCALGGLLLAAFSSAQFSADQKNEVLGEMDQVLSQEAFVPGVDLAKWHTYVGEHKAELEGADSPMTFALAVNGALKEFGFSHIQLLPGRTRRHRGGEDLSLVSAQQGRSGGSHMPALGWIEDDAAILKIPDFESSYDTEFVSELLDKAKDAKYLVIDLRGDPGGEVNNMRHFLGLFLPAETPVGTFVSRKMATGFKNANQTGTDPIEIAKWAHQEIHPIASDQTFAGKVAVLVDGGSASAAEIVANALHESKNSPIVGSPTMGAVLVSTFDRLSFGFRLQFPIGDYVSHTGHRLEGHPLTPDIAGTGSDAVAAALAKLKA